MQETGQAAQVADGTMGGAAEVFRSWALTPAGATLLLLVIGLGIAKACQIGGRIVSGLLTATLTLFLVWVLGGVVEAMGIPVREAMAQVAAQLPWVAGALMRFLAELLGAASV